MTKPFQASAAPLPNGMYVRALTVDLTGQRYGRLTGVKVVGRAANGSLIWLFKCDCGADVERTSASVRKGRPSAVCSCGCYLKEISRERLSNMPNWNKGKTYALKPAGATYATNASWGDAVRRVKGHACEVCGWDKASCDVHHKVPRSKGGKNTVENGQVLCPNCHRLAHIAQAGGSQ